MNHNNDTPPAGKPEPKRQNPETLDSDIQAIVKESFEARGYSVVFETGHILITRDSRTKTIAPSVIMQYIDAFS